MDDHTEDPLTECEETVKELKEENAELRESSERFGALAERLNRANRALADGGRRRAGPADGVQAGR